MTLDTLKGIFAFAFILLLAIGAITTFARVVYLRRQSASLPRLLIRDVLFFLGFSWTTAAVLIVRAAGSTGLADQLWWVLVTSVPPVLSLVVYVYFELFVIGRSS